MARMHNKNKGIARSVIPYSRKSPIWSAQSNEYLVNLVCNLAKKGLVPSQIGVYLRDSEAIGQIKSLSGRNVLRILKINHLAPEIPEDLFFLIRRAGNIRKHLEKNKKDKDSRFRLILTESKIHRLARYYKKKGNLEEKWRYDRQTYKTISK
mmetsp:Transcript_22018/g.34521  ORF Transcript_22018/g.34521 Transcript_22018/m.34521 type:complete len:152 (-) Transcript_22018:386-841(-)